MTASPSESDSPEPPEPAASTQSDKPHTTSAGSSTPETTNSEATAAESLADDSDAVTSRFDGTADLAALAAGTTTPDDETRIPPWVRRSIFLWWGVLVGLWVVVFLARELDSLLTQLVLALFLSFAMEPGVDWLHRRGVHRGAATGLVMFGVLAFFAGFVAAMGSLIASQIDQLATDLPGYAESARNWLEGQFGTDFSNASVVDQLQSGGQAQEFLGEAADRLLDAGGQVLGIVFQLLTVLLFAYYLTAEGPKARRSICSILPPARQMEVLRMWELAINKTGAYILSRVILGLISGIIHWVFFAWLGLPSPLALGLWLGLLSQFIPVVGLLIAGTVPTFIALGIDPTKAVWVLAFITIYQQIENYFLQPRVTSQTLDMHPAVAFAAVLAGTAVFGATGTILALPVLATAQAFVSAYVERHTVVSNPLIGQLTNELTLSSLQPDDDDPA